MIGRWGLTNVENILCHIKEVLTVRVQFCVYVYVWNNQKDLVTVLLKKVKAIIRISIIHNVIFTASIVVFYGVLPLIVISYSYNLVNMWLIFSSGFPRWGCTRPCFTGTWVWFWSSWGSLGLKTTHIFPLAFSTWFVSAPPSGGRGVRAPLLCGTQDSGRECDTWCPQHLPRNGRRALLSETFMGLRAIQTRINQVWCKFPRKFHTTKK